MVHTHGVEGSTPPLAISDEFTSRGILAQLGEHLPYKQRVTGSSPVGPIFCFLNKITCRSGGTGRRPGLKIPWVVIPVPVRFRSAALFFLWDFCEVNICKNLRVFCFMHSIWRQGYYSKNNGIASHLTRYNAVILKSSHFSLKSGPGGNRTRVQKPVPCTSTIIVSYLTFPLPYEN